MTITTLHDLKDAAKSLEVLERLQRLSNTVRSAKSAEVILDRASHTNTQTGFGGQIPYAVTTYTGNVLNESMIDVRDIVVEALQKKCAEMTAELLAYGIEA